MDTGSPWLSLTRRIRQGDRAAEEALAREFEPRVRLVASVRLHGSDAARDVSQDTMLAVLETLRAGRLRDPERLPAFVLGIARNLINNHYRKEGRSREVAGDPPDEAEAAPSSAFLDTERRALVRASLVHVSPLDRRILLLTLVEGLTPREIAPIVDLTPEVVRTRKTRAVRTISEEIRERDTKPSAEPPK